MLFFVQFAECVEEESEGEDDEEDEIEDQEHEMRQSNKDNFGSQKVTD